MLFFDLSIFDLSQSRDFCACAQTAEVKTENAKWKHQIYFFWKTWRRHGGDIFGEFCRFHVRKMCGRSDILLLMSKHLDLCLQLDLAKTFKHLAPVPRVSLLSSEYINILTYCTTIKLLWYVPYQLFFTCNYLNGGHVGGIKTKEPHYLSLKLAPTWLTLYCPLILKGLQVKNQIAFVLHQYSNVTLYYNCKPPVSNIKPNEPLTASYCMVVCTQAI